MYYDETIVDMRAKTWRERLHLMGQLLNGVGVMLLKGEVRITVRNAFVHSGDVVYVPDSAEVRSDG